MKAAAQSTVGTIYPVLIAITPPVTSEHLKRAAQASQWKLELLTNYDLKATGKNSYSFDRGRTAAFSVP